MKNKIENIIHEMYVEMYKAAEPSTDYDELIANAHINENGAKIIDFDSYTIDREAFEFILEHIQKKWKIRKNSINYKILNFNAYLGATPRFK